MKESYMQSASIIIGHRKEKGYKGGCPMQVQYIVFYHKRTLAPVIILNEYWAEAILHTALTWYSAFEKQFIDLAIMYVTVYVHVHNWGKNMNSMSKI